MHPAQERIWGKVASKEQEIRASVRKSQALDDVPLCLKKPRVQFMVKRYISEKGMEKRGNVDFIEKPS